MHGPRIFNTSIFLALTIGIPFCVFKGLFGYLLVENGFAVWGWACLAWAGCDLVMNLGRSFMEMLGHADPPVRFCALGQLGKAFGRVELFRHVDTLLSFLIICFVLWSGWVGQLPRWGLNLWLGATTVNLVSLAVMNICLEALAGPEPGRTAANDNLAGESE